jgi:hypothetical protein
MSSLIIFVLLLGTDGLGAEFFAVTTGVVVIVVSDEFKGTLIVVVIGVGWHRVKGNRSGKGDVDFLRLTVARYGCPK